MVHHQPSRRFAAAIAATVLIIALLCGCTVAQAQETTLATSTTAEEDPINARRQQYVDTALKYLGYSESSTVKSHKVIVDLYNNHEPLALDYKVTYTDSWCAVFVSAVAIECGLTDIIPTECGCERQIQLFQELGCWQEDDDYIPTTGDIIYYSDKGKSSTDNTGWSNHVGIVVSVVGNRIQVIEGNYNNCVRYRSIAVGDAWIRGYGLPDYESKST